MRFLYSLFFLFLSFGFTSEKPNVILILTDDQAYGDMSIHGNPYLKTKYIDRFAKQGVQLGHFYTSPVCTPTRASLMTGRYYYRTGVIHTSRGAAKMSGDEITLAEHFKQNGYRTGLFGKWHLGDNYPMRPMDQGFDETVYHKGGGIGQPPDFPGSYFDPILYKNEVRYRDEGYCTDIFFRETINFIQKSQEPFFIYLPLNAPHTPLEISNNYTERFKDSGLKERDIALYGMIENIDENFGKLLNFLDQKSIRKNTIIIFMSDNGPQWTRYNAHLKGNKGTTYEGGIRVPCFLQWPNSIKGGKTIRTMNAHIDIFPTLIDACQLSSSKKLLDGRSFLPQLKGESVIENRKLYFQCHRDLTPIKYRNFAVKTSSYKLLGNPSTFSSKQDRTYSAKNLELYNTQLDPFEKNNLIKEKTEIAKSLLADYEDWFDEMSQSRNFQPGWIMIDSSKESPCYLSRYQDSSYETSYPKGWPVRINKSGRYRITILRNPHAEELDFSVTWLKSKQSVRLLKGVNSAEFNLQKGQGLLKVELSKKDQIIPIFEKNIVGDILIKKMD